MAKQKQPLNPLKDSWFSSNENSVEHQPVLKKLNQIIIMKDYREAPCEDVTEFNPQEGEVDPSVFMKLFNSLDKLDVHYVLMHCADYNKILLWRPDDFPNKGELTFIQNTEFATTKLFGKLIVVCLKEEVVPRGTMYGINNTSTSEPIYIISGALGELGLIKNSRAVSKVIWTN